CRCPAGGVLSVMGDADLRHGGILPTSEPAFAYLRPMTPDRRATPRQPARPNLVELLDLSMRVVRTGGLGDVSTQGVRGVVASPHPVGAPLVLAPQTPHSGAGSVFTFRVSRMDRLAGGGYEVAGPFLRPLIDAEAIALAS